MISNFGWLCIIIGLVLINGLLSTLEDVSDYKRKKRTDFDYLEFKENKER